ncbi:MAG TPA: DEAD/DEAH box helicase, partial [Thermomicrobiales bacterium]|nr:DEAD/DEAH box helicase [Thermomicrobiales bacterium]
MRPAVSGELTRSSSPSTAPFAIPARTALDLPAKLRWQLAGWYRETGKVAEWQSLLDEMASSGDDTIRLLEERARLAYTTGDMRTAERVLTERRNRAPSATASIALGRFYLGSGEIEKAFRISRELLQARPDLLTVLQLAAEVAHANGDTAAEKEIYERTLAEQPDHAGTLLGLARLEMDAGHPQRAASLAQEAVGPDQEWTTAKQLREAARILIAGGQPELAETLHHRASQQDSARISRLFAEIADALGIGDDGSRPPDRECSDITHKPEIQVAREQEVPDPKPAEAAESTSDPDLDALHPGTLAKLEELFGFPSLRPGQAAVIANVLDRCDTLATMPTGAGKSLTFQLPAMLLKGATLVISPLIALMKDQVDSLPAAVRAWTVLVNSSLSADEQRQALDAIASGQAKLIYAAPERLRQHAFLRALHDANVELLVIDEAHCISLWGHDFRPDYLTIPAVLPVLGEPTVLAITATATPEMAVAIGSG